MSILVQKIEGITEPQTTVMPRNAATIIVDDPISRAKDLLSLAHSIPNGINFEHTRELALECVDEILEHWLPDGELKGREYKACNPTREDSSPDSFSINTVTGVWSDFATDDKGGDLISLVAYLAGLKYQSEAAITILELIAGLRTDDALVVAKRNTKKKISPKPEYTAIMPIPEEAMSKRPLFFGMELGSPVATWEYRNAAGQAMFYVNRFNAATGGKSFLPQTFCKDSTGWEQWKMMAPPVPRPAYGLDRLADRPDATVIFTEGEKSADAAQRLFPDFVAVTTMNGSKSPEKSDFTPFAGRKIYIAADNDDAGLGYQNALIQLLRSADADVAMVMRLEMLKKNGQPLADGYDLADAEANEWTADDLAKLGDSLWEPVSNVDPVPPNFDAPKPTNKNSKAEPNDKKLSQLGYAMQFAIQNHGGNVAHFSNQVLAYSDGYWPALDINVEIKKPLLAAMGDVTANMVNAVFELVKIHYGIRPELFERKSGLSCLNNGTLNPITGKLLPHSVEHYLTNKLDINYDAEAKCPLWLQTLGEIFEPDIDRAEKLELLQEYIGYCLIPDTRMCKFVWMIGPGGNGKSLILDVVEELIGKANITNAHIDRFQDKFVRAELQGKLVNISSEMSSDATIADSYLKQIVSGDSVEAERKHEPSFSFRPYVRIIASTNKLPRLQDHSDGFARRAIFITFNRKFTESEQDKQRKSKLLAELPGILNWAVAGLQRLMERGAFTIPASSKAAVEQYRMNSDPVRQFAESFLQKATDKSQKVASGLLYDRYREWSLANGYKAAASNTFAERLTDIGFEKKKASSGAKWNAAFNDPNGSATNIGYSMPLSASHYDV